MKPRVTIIVTVYQRTKFLRDALASALIQTFQDYEIIVTDDSQSALVREICESFSEPRRIRYRANPQTLGVALNVRAALEEAQGLYIAILNDDDLWEPEFLAHLVPALENDSRRVLAFSDHWIVREDGAVDAVATDANTRRYGRAALPEGEVAETRRLVLALNGVPLAMAALFRKDAVEAGVLVQEVAGAYDFWLSCLLAASGGSFYYVPRRLTRYRAHPTMESARRSPDKSENQVYIFTKLLEWDSFPDWREHLRSNLGAAQFRVGRDNLYFDRPTEARHCFQSAFRTHRDWRPPLAYLLSFLPFRIRMALRLTGSRTLTGGERARAWPGDFTH